MVDLSHYRGECDCCDAVMELRARLDAVESLCIDADLSRRNAVRITDVRAAARGEGDR